MKFFNLDEQISNICLKAVGITDNQTVNGGLIGLLNDTGAIGTRDITNTYTEALVPELHILFYAVAGFVLICGVLSYFLYTLGSLHAYSYLVIMEVVKRIVLGSVLVVCATWILGWIVELADALSLMFGLNAEIMAFVVSMFTSAYSCVFLVLGVIGVYGVSMFYIAQSYIHGSLEVIFIIAVTLWIFGAIESNMCKSVEGLGLLLIRLMLWGIFMGPVMSLCYGIGMGIMMVGDDPSAVMVLIGILVLLCSCVVPTIIFFKFVYNPITPVVKGVYMAGRIL